MTNDPESHLKELRESEEVIDTNCYRNRRAYENNYPDEILQTLIKAVIFLMEKQVCKCPHCGHSRPGKDQSEDVA